ncbi:MAG TPA: c-type cytochrome [Vicinamibacterales bacterium]
MRAVTAGVGVCVALVAIGCSSNSGGGTSSPTTPTNPSPSTPTATFSQVSSQVFTPACVGCHTDDGRTPAGGLNLKSSVAYAGLVNVASSGKPGAIRVIPGDPNNSYLVQKLEGAAGIVGLRMPRNGPPYLSDAQVALIRQWIAAGAGNN